MSDSDDKVAENLSQIRVAVEQGLDGMDEMKRNADAELLPHLQRIEQEGWSLILSIKDIEKRQNEKQS